MELARTGSSAVSYTTARKIIAAVGLIVLLATAALLYATGIDSVEVLAVLLYLPIFLGLLLWGASGGAAAGVMATALYAAMRYPAMHAIGGRDLTTLVASRGAGFLAFGVVGGWAKSRLQASITKLDLYDEIDDATGLFNARHFVTTVDYESERGRRYEKIFSIALVEFPSSLISGRSGRVSRQMLLGLGASVRSCIRKVDRAVHTVDGARHRFAVILPDTGPDGADVFLGRLREAIQSRLTVHDGFTREPELTVAVASYPQDIVTIGALIQDFAEEDRLLTGRLFPARVLT